MSNELQSTPSSPTPASKKAWNAPEIQIISLREAQTKGKGVADGFNFRSH